MLVFLRTQRYGVETSITYHGSKVDFDDELNWLTVHDPWVEGQDAPAVLTQVTIVNGDEFTVVNCSDRPDMTCQHADF